MKLSALDYLVCIHCQGALRLNPHFVAEAEDTNEVQTGVLECTSCSIQFRIERGVPRLVDENKSCPINVMTGRSFASAWQVFPRMDERYRQQFFDWIYPVNEAFMRDKIILECGCGKGRHAKICAEAGAQVVFAIDIGDAVDIAYKNVGKLPTVHVVQADIENLPFAQIFDFVFAVGVLHHMTDPRDGFISMCSRLKQDGSACAWVYGRENNWWLIRIVNPIRVRITSKLSTEILEFVSKLITIPLFIICKFMVAPWVAMRKIMPWLPALFYQDYLAYISRFDFNELHHIVYDHLAAPVANYVSRAYFDTWFVTAQLSNPIIRWHNKNSWTGFASRNPALLAQMHSKVRQLQQSAPNNGRL